MWHDCRWGCEALARQCPAWDKAAAGVSQRGAASWRANGVCAAPPLAGDICHGGARNGPGGRAPVKAPAAEQRRRERGRSKGRGDSDGVRKAARKRLTAPVAAIDSVRSGEHEPRRSRSQEAARGVGCPESKASPGARRGDPGWRAWRAMAGGKWPAASGSGGQGAARGALKVIRALHYAFQARQWCAAVKCGR